MSFGDWEATLRGGEWEPLCFCGADGITSLRSGAEGRSSLQGGEREHLLCVPEECLPGEGECQCANGDGGEGRKGGKKKSSSEGQ